MPGGVPHSASRLSKSGGFEILFFSRGRGKGHAVPDIALAEELQALVPDIEILWVSYGTGAAVLREHGCDVIDLQLPDANPFLETQLRVTRILAHYRPRLVISHEEFAVAPMASLFGIPIMFITDYFLAHSHLWMQCLAYANEVVFIDDIGFFEEPAYLRGKVHYAGPFVRRLTYSRVDRGRARSELQLPSEDTIVVLVLPGNWFTEERAPIYDIVISAYRSLPASNKRLVWIAGQDYRMLALNTANDPDVLVLEADPQIDRWMVACDVAITKATRKTSLELAYLGIPSISLSQGLNPIDDIRVTSIPSNTHLRIRDLNENTLLEHMLRILAEPLPPECRHQTTPAGLSIAAQKLADRVAYIRQST